MSTTTPPEASAWPRHEWPIPRAAKGNGAGEEEEDRMSAAMSVGTAGWRTAPGAALTIWPKSIDAFAVELWSMRSLEAMPRPERSPGRPRDAAAGSGRSWPATTTEKKLLRMANARTRILAMLALIHLTVMIDFDLRDDQVC
jgi:hypothetical protein